MFNYSIKYVTGAAPLSPVGLNDADQMNLVHFLHIGKCAGTTIRSLINSVNQNRSQMLIMAHGHRVVLSDIPPKARFFFSIRDPITRFYSGFYSRKRKGQPYLYVEWGEGERKAFARFPEANDLAESLFDNSPVGLQAFSAMQSIRHVKQPQYSWFPDLEEIFDSRPPICILRQENLEADVRYLGKVLDLPKDITLETDNVRAHKNDYSATPPLSSRAVENLKRWYAADINFYALATSWVERNQK
ncbi:MAG: sulfotransferase family 2 domain-containing protein [Thiobacillus sp.]|uniref:sulfotransferase family 2 domain-containing protein n=1 Tax=Thiobacillus sp. TaxID=924 RepID=UPI002733761F|nr:sulfotransferase family 2 domain-containing protein [Thiobacillus sp.]MDP3584459.1 sulfotransferase family 2 domain-containing protein [Thiobacillus sp.]